MRTQRGLLPTPLNQVTFDPELSTETLTICTHNYLQSALMLPLLVQLQPLAPNMRLGVCHQEVVEVTAKLVGGEIDISLGIPDVSHVFIVSVRNQQVLLITRDSQLHEMLAYQRNLSMRCC